MEKPAGTWRRRCVVGAGIDFLAEPIAGAKKKAAERGETATFLVMDSLALKDLPEMSDNLIDSGLFQVFSDEDKRRYVEGLTMILKPSVRLFLFCFSDDKPGTQGSGQSPLDQSRSKGSSGSKWCRRR